jgi:2-keto-3-deoxy-6-phosphogluconate aldolase
MAGVTKEEVQALMKADAFGVGSSLVNKKLLDAGDLDELTRRAKAFIVEIHKGRQR